jgi:hypothetical protein
MYIHITRRGKQVKESQDKTGITGQAGQDRQNMTDRTGHTEQYGQN